MNNKIVLLCSDADSSRAIYHSLKNKFGEILVIMENPISRINMAKKRVKRMGYIKVAGQILFVVAVVPVLSRLSVKRVAEINKEYDLRNDWGGAPINRVESVNSEETRGILKQLQPKVVVINGTRIISKKTLDSVDSIFINTHAGITPLYRGVHGAYWALAEDNSNLVGTTVHIVDKGIDTGKIIDQTFFEVSKKDNFATYPYLHTANGIPILLKAVEKHLNGKLETQKPNDLPSKLRYHPSIWEYIYYWMRKGVK